MSPKKTGGVHQHMNTSARHNKLRHSNYCTIMIKLLGVFDKTLKLNCSATADENNLIQDMIIEELTELDEARLPCPFCGNVHIKWKPHQSTEQTFIWNNPDQPLKVSFPQLSFYCSDCFSHGSSIVTTDITVGRTKLSYHYLFRILHDFCVIAPAQMI